MTSKTLPMDVRQWSHFPIVLPVSVDGKAPVIISEAVTIVYEVWDKACVEHGSFDYLPEAVNLAMKLSLEELNK